MRKLNRNKDFGTICPPEKMEGCDRAAFYTQDDVYFDAHDRLIVPGQSIDTPPPPTVQSQDEGHTWTVHELLAAADTIPSSLLQREAKRILQGACPAGKPQIIVALKKAIGDYTDKKERRGQGRPRAAPAEVDADEPDAGEAETPASAPPPAEVKTAPAKKGAVDLRAWALGQNYLFGEVRKAIRQQFSVQISGANEKMEALELCVAKKIVTAAEARKDFKEIAVPT